METCNHRVIGPPAVARHEKRDAMHVVVIGATGRVGSYLVPRLVEAGHKVTAITHSLRKPYHSHAAWGSVDKLVIDRPVEQSAGRFGQRVRELQPDAVIDMICFTPQATEELVTAVRGHVQHFLHCGTIWVHRPSACVPTTKESPRQPFGDYGIQKAAIESYTPRQHSAPGFPATILHPGHIVGPGEPLNPAGHFNLQVFEQLAEKSSHFRRRRHGDRPPRPCGRCGAGIRPRSRIARPPWRKLPRRVARRSSLRGYAEAVARWFGKEPKLRYVPFEEWQTDVPQHNAAYTWDHIAHSPNCSIAKAGRLLEYQPRYTRPCRRSSRRCTWLMHHGRLNFAKA